MLYYVKIFVLTVLAILLVTVAVANREIVQLHLLPRGLVPVVGVQHTIRLPLFVVILGGVLTGLLIGFLWEWLREARIRRLAERRRRDLALLERENARLRRERREGEDEVLVLLDEPPARATGTALATRA